MAEVTFLTIEHAPNKATYFVGDKFEKYGMLVRAHYDDSTSSLIDFYSFSPFGEYTGSRRLINAVASELLKHAKDVDMEDKEDWFELWKHLIK